MNAAATFAYTDAILRRRMAALGPAGSLARRARLAAHVVVAGALYGAVMGTFGGLSGDRVWQIVYSAAKAPVLLFGTFLISLPSFFVVNTLLGLRRDWPRALEAVVATQAVAAIALASFAPLTALWYASSADYQQAILFNACMFAAASLAGHIALRQFYRPLIERNRRHRLVLRTWLGVYAFVGVQMGWILRPFIGGPNTPVQFFRADTWGNAYLIVGRLVWDVIH